MAKVNRNAPCPCGSGKKHKRCCLPQDREAAAAAEGLDPQASKISPPLLSFVDSEDDIDKLSNSVVDLINEGRLDEAEEACRELESQFPDAIDWIERTGALHEARGELRKAVEYYRRCLDYIDQHPDYFEEASKDWYRRSIKRLESGAESTAGSSSTT